MPLFEKTPRNNGVLMHNYDYSHPENGRSIDETSGIMLQPVDGGQHDRTPMPVVVSYGPGARTSTSVPQIVNYSQKSSLVGGRCYCKARQMKSKLIILAVAVLVMGTAIGALIMYFTGSFQCLDKNGECHLYTFPFVGIFAGVFNLLLKIILKSLEPCHRNKEISKEVRIHKLKTKSNLYKSLAWSCF